MDAPGSTIHWEQSPVPQLVMTEKQVLAANDAFFALIGHDPEVIIDREDWHDRVFDIKNKIKFFRYVVESRRPSVHVEIQTARKHARYVRVERRILPDEQFLVALTDLTALKEEAHALQAGYDEFINLTIELEKAKSAIEDQNALLEKQKSTLENELSLAHKVQTQLFAQDFQRFNYLRMAGFYETMADLGGDMWEFGETRDEFLGVIGDVMGHGVAASLISIAAKTIFKSRFQNDGKQKNLGQICNDVNEELLEITRGNYYVTICLVRIDRNYRMEYVTGGHPPLYLVRADSDAPGEQLFTPQPMLGIFPGQKYRHDSIQLLPGDRVLMYTDCLLETFDTGGNQLQLDEITNLIRFRPETVPQDVIDALLNYRRSFAASAHLPDDLAMACLEVPINQQYNIEPPAMVDDAVHQNNL
ncbi:MAG: SpoIIE family protein phosphatase [Leptospiraceae bacterium]|nr:SpoIIE family protein phosphatase [Leptospiraceae bacterium]